MAYRFNGSSDYVRFALGPFNGYTFDPYTVAVLLKRNSTATNQGTIVFNQASVVDYRWFLQILASNALRWRGNLLGLSDSPQTVSSTSVWYLLVVTRAAGSSVKPRFHVWDGSSWNHGDGNTALGQITVASTDLLDLGGIGASGSLTNFLAADVVCVGIKKADSSDSTVQTLNVTAFSTWAALGFDWLIGFDASGTRSNQGGGTGGNEASRSGTSLVSDPPGWSFALTTTWNGSSTVSLIDTVTTAGTRVGVTYHGATTTTETVAITTVSRAVTLHGVSTVSETVTVTTSGVVRLPSLVLIPRSPDSLVLVPRPPDSLVLTPR